ncbi:MAG TPA: metal-dependent hydrolase, partial [Methanoregulaceae archaeon]|nr:metal-dependent hydrolase [Methanoregulaceae archaeon]
MLIFCHLLAGATIGLLGNRERVALPLLAAGIVGALLPDLIDKPIGHLLLGALLDNGRVFSHTLAFFLLVTILGILFYRHRDPLTGPVLGLGVLSHQVLDAMWRDPSAWFYPLLGPFVPGRYPDFFLRGLIAEVSSPAEWLFGLTVLALVLVAVRPVVAGPAGRRLEVIRLLPSLGALVGLLGLLTLVAVS